MRDQSEWFFDREVQPNHTRDGYTVELAQKDNRTAAMCVMTEAAMRAMAVLHKLCQPYDNCTIEIRLVKGEKK